ncbi:MAG: AAA family ATPase, partial [Succinivibrionaceae bacterium]|nr:AAA family ATPase [Succinivibrionaceae bacterium]
MIKNIPTSQTMLPVIIDEGYAFVDKTKSIETYEKSKSRVSLFLRPRRFGKTMFIEMLKYYYDEALKEESTRIFKGKYIASHPTEKKSGYYVVSFDFSGIGTKNGLENTLNAFSYKIIVGIRNFYLRYPDLIPRDIQRMKEQEEASLEDCIAKYYKDEKLFSDSTAIITSFLTRLQAFQNKIMVLIDEYDNFTNDILSRDVNTFAELARKGGDISMFYQVLRSCQQLNIIDRIFIAGVLPITLDTSLSSFVFDRVYEYPEFNEMAGFTDDDVANLLKDTLDFDKCGFSLDTLRGEMKKRYNGYRFAEEGEFTVYNPALCLNFIKKLISLDYKKIPPLQTVSGNDIDFDKFAGYMGLVNQQDMDSIISSIDVDSDPDNPSSAGYIEIYALSESIKVTSDENRLNYSEGATLLYH